MNWETLFMGTLAFAMCSCLIYSFVKDAIEEHKKKRYDKMVNEEYYRITGTKWPGYSKQDLDAHLDAMHIVDLKLRLEELGKND